MIIHLQPLILECEVKWALGSITTNKASGGDGIPVELFQIMEDDAVKLLHSICQQIWKTAMATGLEKVSFYEILKKTLDPWEKGYDQPRKHFKKRHYIT